MSIDFDDLRQVQQRIAELQTEQRDRLPRYISAKQVKAMYKNRAARLLSRFEQQAPDESMVAKKSWALSQLAYIEAQEQLEGQLGDAMQECESYETIQPQLDMLRSQLSLAKAQIEHL